MMSNIARRNRGLGLKQAFAAAWNPEPIAEPVLDDGFSGLGFFARTAESIKYFTLRLEYFLSPGGWLRAWFKLNLLLSIILAVPVVLIMPVLTAFMAGMATLTLYLLQTAYNILMAMICVIFILAILTVILAVAGHSYNQNKSKKG